MIIRRGWAVLALCIVLAACSSNSGAPDGGDGGNPLVADGGDGGSEAMTGELSVTIQGLDAGTADVTVTGPGGDSQALGGTGMLTGLSPGTYTVTANTVRLPGTLVDSMEVPDLSVSTVTVTAGQTASVTLTYAPDGLSGQLWMPGLSLPEVDALPEPLLLNGGAIDGGRAVQLAWPDGGTTLQPQNLAFDRSGRLWATVSDPTLPTVNNGAPVLLGWDRAALLGGGTSAPSVVIATADAGSGYTTLDSPLTLAFDPSGNLWVGDCGWNSDRSTLSQFPASSLTSSGAPLPSQVITLVNAACPEGLSFDAQGNLWVADNAAPPLLLEYTASELAAPSPSPAVQMTLPAPFDYPTASAFDAQGTLWVAQAGSFIGVTGYPAAELADGGSNPPELQLTSSTWTNPVGLAFDNGGNLWVVDLQGLDSAPTPILSEVAASDLSASGSVTLKQVITVHSDPWSWAGLAFYPSPSALPMYR